MKASSEDLRLKVVDAVDEGMPRKEVAQIFGISVPSIKRWLRRRRETGGVEPSPRPGPPAKKGALPEGWLPGLGLEDDPDLTLEGALRGVRGGFGSKGIDGHTMSRGISRLPGGGWPLKKSPP